MHPMYKFKVFLILFALIGFTAVGMAAEGAVEHAEEEHHGLTTFPLEVGNIGPLVITNSMVVTIIVTGLLIFFAQLATRNIKLVPDGVQNFAEMLIESLYEFFETVVGTHMIRKTFWFFGTIFIFILATNWFGLVPGVGTIGWATDAPVSGQTFHPWLRGGNADLNMTSAMAMIFFVMWIVWAIQHNGAWGTVTHIFAMPKGVDGFMKYAMIGIFMFIGAIEVVSIAFRPVALSFRLFGNVFAGENILESMLVIHPWLGWIIPLPFYFLELLVGLIQAMVFALLGAVFTALICEDHSHEKEEH